MRDVKTMKKKQLDKLWVCLVIVLFMTGTIGVIYLIYSNIHNNGFIIEFVAKKWVPASEQYCHSQPISADKAVAFINYNCVKHCLGQYIIFIDKIDGEWVVNESSKKVLW